MITQTILQKKWFSIVFMQNHFPYLCALFPTYCLAIKVSNAFTNTCGFDVRVVE